MLQKQAFKHFLSSQFTFLIDSGHYTCDVFNNVGAIHRDFRVDVRDRIRARPIILPNILMNKTVDVNGTVNFTCQVLSDLVPHVVWIVRKSTRIVYCV